MPWPLTSFSLSLALTCLSHSRQVHTLRWPPLPTPPVFLALSPTLIPGVLKPGTSKALTLPPCATLTLVPSVPLPARGPPWPPPPASSLLHSPGKALLRSTLSVTRPVWWLRPASLQPLEPAFSATQGFRSSVDIDIDIGLASSLSPSLSSILASPSRPWLFPVRLQMCVAPISRPFLGSFRFAYSHGLQSFSSGFFSHAARQASSPTSPSSVTFTLANPTADCY